MRAVDTNVLVRLIARDDFRQTASAESFIEKALGFQCSHWLRRRGCLPLSTS
jgi:predicted nucleic-acid-binding protein